MKRIISFLLLSVLAILCLASCKTVYHSNNEKTALTVGDTEISYDLFRYFYCSYKYAEGNENKTHEEIVEEAITRLKELVAIEEMADTYDLEVGKDTLKLLKQEMEAMRASYKTEEEMIESLNKGYVCEKVYYDIYYFIELEYVVSSYFSDVANRLTTDEEIKKEVKDTFLAAMNIVIYPDTEHDGLRGEALAKALRQRILDGEDMAALAKEYSDDKNIEPRYFAPMTMQAYFEEKVGSLKIGEVSEVYETELGYSITKRIEITDDYIKNNIDSLREEFVYSEYLKVMTQHTSSYEVVFADDFDMTLVDY
ncbi:MAG: hypothetical protein E7675_01020 [Ruminococcaceae bacterium]|nr:hypothetical protein [Oscillospiraceae bacterium]